jgi:preprotein translocase subunit SecY
VASALSKNSELLRKIVFTLAMLAIYRIGVHVPTPGVDSSAVAEFFRASQGFFGLFDAFTGGALSQFSVFALGIFPYISASIIFQLLSATVPSLEALKKEGEHGRKKITQYTRYATLLLCVIQGYAVSSFIMSIGTEGKPVVTSTVVGFVPFQLMTIITLSAGAIFVMWLGEQITERGISNGASLIIFTGIAASIPAGVTRLWSLISTGEVSTAIAVAAVLFLVLLVAFVVYMEVAQRRIPVQYSQRGVGMQSMVTPQSHLPLKLNHSGVIPIIFAQSLLFFPATILQFTDVAWLRAAQDMLVPDGAIFNILFVALIVFFCFFYSEIVFKPDEVADNLKKYGGYIPGVRAGKSTAEHIQRVLDRINVAGAAYLCGVCILPGMILAQANISFHFGGSSLLILVGVALDTSQRIQSHIISQKYEGLMKGAKIRSRRVQF